jgi:hypothetical protein
MPVAIGNTLAPQATSGTNPTQTVGITVAANGSSYWFVVLMGSGGIPFPSVATVTDGFNTWIPEYILTDAATQLQIQVFVADGIAAGNHTLLLTVANPLGGYGMIMSGFELQGVSSPSYGGAGATLETNTPASPVSLAAAGVSTGLVILVAFLASLYAAVFSPSGGSQPIIQENYCLFSISEGIFYVVAVGGSQSVALAYTAGTTVYSVDAVALYTSAATAPPPAGGPLYSGL